MAELTPLPLWMTLGRDDDLHRREDCWYLTACLARAAAERWRAMSCVACSAWQRLSPVDSLVRVDLIGGRPTIFVVDEDEGEDQYTVTVDDEDEDDMVLTGREVVILGDQAERGLYPIYSGTAIVEAARRADIRFVRAIHVGIARCPACEASPQLTLGGLGVEPPAPLRDGWCEGCRGFLEGTESGVTVRSEERSRLAEQLAKARRAA